MKGDRDWFREAVGHYDSLALIAYDRFDEERHEAWKDEKTLLKNDYAAYDKLIDSLTDAFFQSVSEQFLLFKSMGYTHFKRELQKNFLEKQSVGFAD